ncbi:hypothetical protein GYMLUDRAFT_237275 [Collybiopsis luxurians FD-317 M1]|nr:hypothetical protein GYMLUDRAFT_237275 [Collybiopsis luxurians FD-317 M1]
MGAHFFFFPCFNNAETWNTEDIKLNQYIQEHIEGAERRKGAPIPENNKLAARVIHRWISTSGKTVESNLSGEAIGEFASFALTYAANSPAFSELCMKPIMNRFMDNLNLAAYRRGQWTQLFRQRELDELGVSTPSNSPSFNILQNYLPLSTPLIVLRNKIELGACIDKCTGDDINEIYFGGCSSQLELGLEERES